VDGTVDDVLITQDQFISLLRPVATYSSIDAAIAGGGGRGGSSNSSSSNNTYRQRENEQHVQQSAAVGMRSVEAMAARITRLTMAHTNAGLAGVGSGGVGNEGGVSNEGVAAAVEELRSEARRLLLERTALSKHLMEEGEYWTGARAAIHNQWAEELERVQEELRRVQEELQRVQEGQLEVVTAEVGRLQGGRQGGREAEEHAEAAREEESRWNQSRSIKEGRVAIERAEEDRCSATEIAKMREAEAEREAEREAEAERAATAHAKELLALRQIHANKEVQQAAEQAENEKEREYIEQQLQQRYDTHNARRYTQR
jgi:hypothetical protein